MKSQLTVPSTPVKRRCAPVMVCSGDGVLICEGSYYRVYLTGRGTVLRAAKRRTAEDAEIEILERVHGEHLNRMLRWWKDDGLKYFEMEYCSGGDVGKLMERYRNGSAIEDLPIDRKMNNAEKFDQSSSEETVGKQEELESKEKTLQDSNEQRHQEKCAPSETNTLEVVHSQPMNKIQSTAESATAVNQNTSKVPDFTGNCPERKQEEDNDPFDCIECLLDQNTPNIIEDSPDYPEASSVCASTVLPDWAVRLMLHVSGALVLLHSAGYIHMDIKPANILVEGDRFILCDFNISCAGEGAVQLDGDPIYMAPEILRNRCFFASDVFSLGLLYLELCNPGRSLPRTGDAYKRIRHNEFAGWHVDALCRRMLEHDPAKRCTAAEVRAHFLNR